VRNAYASVEQIGKKIRYKRGKNLSSGLDKARELLGKRRSALNRLVDLFRPLNTEQCEIIATLYACWNDILLDAHFASDDSIVEEFLGAWHERKRRFSKQRLFKALGWMKAHRLIQAGQGPHTVKNRRAAN
jgi:hypothetical protein